MVSLSLIEIENESSILGAGFEVLWLISVDFDSMSSLRCMCKNTCGVYLNILHRCSLSLNL